MKLPHLNKKRLILIGPTLIAVVAAGFGIWQYFLQPSAPAQTVSAESLSIPNVRIVRNPDNKEDSSESASSRRSDEKIATIFQWGDRTLSQNIRKMENAQSGLASGDTHASSALKESMIAISDFLKEAKLEELRPLEIESVVEYTLSGGGPDFAKKILSVHKLSKSQTSLLRGAIAFVEGDRKQAKEMLTPLDAAQFKPFIAARIWMMKAELDDAQPYNLRRIMLARAADYSLGTLIEEAAIRRLVALAVHALSAEDFFYWSGRYMRRFPKSLYMADFLANFTDGVSIFELAHNPLQLEQVDQIFRQLSKEGMVQFAKNVQATALRLGEARLCEYGYQKNKELAHNIFQPNDPSELYALACQIISPKGETLSRLAKFDIEKLSITDRRLYSAARALAKGIEYESSAPPQEPYGPLLPYPQFDSVKALAASVRQQFESTDQVIKRIRK